MKHAVRTFVLTLCRLNLWIAALLLVGLLHDPQGPLQAQLAAQFSAQPVSMLSAAPKFALAKPTPAEARARLFTLLDPVAAVQPTRPTGFHLLRRADAPAMPRLSIGHGWQARAPPVPTPRPI